VFHIVFAITFRAMLQEQYRITIAILPVAFVICVEMAERVFRFSLYKSCYTISHYGIIVSASVWIGAIQVTGINRLMTGWTGSMGLNKWGGVLRIICMVWRITKWSEDLTGTSHLKAMSYL